jgi:exocyst complex protein 7
MATLGLGYLASFSARKLEEMKWEEIEEGVNRWGRDVGAIVGVLMAGERELCERALRNLGAADRAACFADIAAQSNMAVFFRYARAVAGTRHRPEALLVGLLELLRGLSVSNTGIAAVFRGCPDVLRSVGEAKRALAQNAARALGELAASVEAKMAPVPGDGGKDRSASFVVNYMGMVVRDYKPAMEEALSLYRQQSQGQGAQSGFGPLPIMCSSLKNAALGMMGALERSLEQRARSHPDPALAHLFLMNNYRHVLMRLKECVGLADCLADDFKLAWRHKVELNMRSYIKRSWEPVIANLSRDGLHHHSSGSVNRGLVASKLAGFDQAFDRVCRVQANWVVLDDVLRDNIYLSVLQLLSPAYHNFMQLYGAYVEQDDRVHKYTAETLENRVRNLFRGGR